jgi:hypothetical protein
VVYKFSCGGVMPSMSAKLAVISTLEFASIWVSLLLLVKHCDPLPILL